MKRNLAALVTSKADTWGTPVDFYEYLDRQFAFTIDVCALESNTEAPAILLAEGERARAVVGRRDGLLKLSKLWARHRAVDRQGT
jgi:hypothetical protein